MNINRRLLSQLSDLKNSVDNPDQKKLIDMVIKIVMEEENAPPLSALSNLLTFNNKPIVYKVVDIICRFVIMLGEHEACVQALMALKHMIETIKF